MTHTLLMTTSLLLGCAVGAQAQPLGSFSDGRESNLTMDAPVDGSLQYEPVVLGFDFSGMMQAEYRAWSSGTEYGAALDADLTYGFALGSGTATIGVGIKAEYLGSASDVYVELEPWGAYTWGKNTASVGYVESSYAYAIKPHDWTSSFIRDFDPNSLGVRFDTTFKDKYHLSVSYDEQEELSIGGHFSVNDRIEVFGAGIYNFSTDNYVATLRGTTNFDPLLVALTYSFYGGGNHLIEGQANYSITDSLLAIAYIGADISGGSTAMYYSASFEYILISSISSSAYGLTLFGGYEHSDTYDDFTIGLRSDF